MDSLRSVKRARATVQSDLPEPYAEHDLLPDLFALAPAPATYYPQGEGETKETSSRWFPEGNAALSAEALVAQETRAAVSRPQKDEICSICRDEFEPHSKDRCVRLDKCLSEHFFHQSCIIEALRVNPRCPNCLVMFAAPKGTQPNGKMTVVRHHAALPGEACNSMFIIVYQFPSGIQGPDHPNPGQPYHGTSRRAFLPASEDGCRVLLKIMKAWDARLLFTVGTSVTTGQQNAIIWNGIHHKTNTTGGPCQFGFPDATYLKRVEQELAAAGIF